MTIEELEIKLGLGSTLKEDTNQASNSILGLERTVSKSSSGMIRQFTLVGAALYGVKVIASTVSQALQSSISRVDTLNNFPKTMANLGIGSNDAKLSIDRLSEGLKGLPTTIDDAALSVQRFTSSNNNIMASTEMFLALNNAVLAGNAPMDMQRSALEQLSQAYAKGKPDMMEWRSAISAMPAQMKQVAIAMGYVSADALGESMRKGNVSMNEFMLKLMELNTTGQNGFLSFEEQARNSTGGIATSITNVKTSVTRGLADIMNAIGQTNIASFFNGVASMINAVIPYITALVKVTVMAINGLAVLFGGTTAKVNAVAETATSGAQSMSSIGDSALESAKSVDGLTKSAQKLAKTIAPFDTAQILRANSKDGSGKGDGGSGGGDVNLGFDGLDLQLGEAESKTDKAMKNIMAILDQFNFDPLIKSFIELKNAVLPIAETIGGVLGYLLKNILFPLAQWTISDLLPAFVNLLAGVLRVANPIIKAAATVGMFLFEVFLIPAAKFAGGLFVATINFFAQALKGLGIVLENNQPLLIASIATIGIFYAAFKTAQIMAFVAQVGGLGNAVKVLTGDFVAATARKVAFKVATLAATTATLADTLANKAASLSTASDTTATVGNTVAKHAYTLAAKLATGATVLLNGALTLLSGPVGWVIGAITAVVGLFALYQIGADKASVATDGLSENQKELISHFENTEERLSSQKTAFDTLADDTLLKLKSNYEDLTRTLARERLDINTEGLEAIGEKTQSAFNTAREAIATNTDLMYQGLSSFYENSNLLTEEQEMAILDKILTSGQEQQNTVQGHQDAMNAIKNQALEEGRGLNATEIEEYQFHLDEMNRIAIETITPEHARQIAQLESFNSKKGKLNEEEREEYLRLQSEKFESELEKIQTEMGFQLDALNKAKYNKIITEQEYNAQKGELIDQMNAKEYTMMDQQAREILSMATGLSGDQLNVHNQFANDYAVIQNKKLSDVGYVAAAEERIIEENYRAREKDLQNTKSSMKDFNDNWLSQQPAKFKGVYENITRGMSLQSGINQISGQRGNAYDAGLYATQGITAGVNDGQSGAVAAMGSLAFNMIARAKRDLEIRSPSRVMRKLFGFVGEGAALGVDDNADDVAKSMGTLVTESLAGIGDLEMQGDMLVHKFLKGFDFSNTTADMNMKFTYPDFIGDNSQFNVSRTLSLEEGIMNRLDGLMSSFEKMVQLDADRTYVIENKLSVEMDADTLVRKTQRSRLRNQLRTGEE